MTTASLRFLLLIAATASLTGCCCTGYCDPCGSTWNGCVGSFGSGCDVGCGVSECSTCGIGGGDDVGMLPATGMTYEPSSQLIAPDGTPSGATHQYSPPTPVPSYRLPSPPVPESAGQQLPQGPVMPGAVMQTGYRVPSYRAPNLLPRTGKCSCGLH